MLTIRHEQLKALEAAMNEPWYDEFMSRLQMEFPQRIEKLSKEELCNQVDQGCQAAQELGIVEKSDIYRFLRLRYLPGTVWEQPSTQQVFYQVITDTSVDASTRLDFIERNIAFVRKEWSM